MIFSSFCLIFNDIDMKKSHFDTVFLTLLVLKSDKKKAIRICN